MTTLVTETRLKPERNQALYDYFPDVVTLQAFLIRRTVHHLRKGLNGEAESKYRTRLMADFNVTNRFAKVVMGQAKKILKLSREAERYRYEQLSVRRNKLLKKIEKWSQSKQPRKRTKRKLFYGYRKLNRLNQLIRNGPRETLTFGTKRLQKRDRDAFIAKRDNQFMFIGDKYDFKGNQQFQLTFDAKRNVFYYKMRYDNPWLKSIITIDKYAFGEFVITDKFAKQHIRAILATPQSRTLSFRIIRRGTYLNLQIIYGFESPPVTRNSCGVLGVDFNKGFITVADINEHGHLKGLAKLNYIHEGPVGLTTNAMRHMVKDLVELAKATGKDLVIENLKSLNNKKDKSERKHYNRMLNLLKFGCFRKLLEQACAKHGIGLHTINPYQTSKIARDKYCDSLKLNIHSGAAYVIARRHYQLD